MTQSTTGSVKDALVHLATSINLRDIGGKVAVDGRRVKRGMLYRSGEPRKLDADAEQALDLLGIVMVCDMRAEVERKFRPISHAGYQQTRLITCTIAESNADLWSHLEGRAASADAVRGTMIEVYRRLPVEQAPMVRDLISAIAEGHLPLLFHCAAGKDRTGFAAAVLLAMLGVPDEAIFEDYALTASWVVGRRERFLRKKREAGQDENIWYPLFECPADYLLTALAVIRSHQGGMDGWLVSIGITPKQLDAARGILLEHAA